MHTLRFGPLSHRTTHVAVDMQIYFAESSEWAASGTAIIAPRVVQITKRCPERTIFTRFLTPTQASDALGHWQHYYKRWESVLAGRNDPGMFDLLPVLRHFVPPARVVDKYAYSAYECASFEVALAALETDTVIFSGVETDVCVLATALTAVDRGLRVVVVSDATASSSEAGHEATLSAIYPRFDQQIELIDTETLLKEWRP